MVRTSSRPAPAALIEEVNVSTMIRPKSASEMRSIGCSGRTVAGCAGALVISDIVAGSHHVAPPDALGPWSNGPAPGTGGIVRNEGDHHRADEGGLGPLRGGSRARCGRRLRPGGGDRGGRV